MKRILLSASLGVVIVASIFQTFSRSEATRTPQSYPLVCRGAASLEIGAPEPSSWDVGFTFTRGTKPAGEGLAPGQCSWVDRAMHLDEPDKLYKNVEGEEYPPGKKPWFLELHSPDKYWTFMVSNQLSKYGWRQLTATSASPFEFTVIGTAKLPSDLEVIRSYPLICRGGPGVVMDVVPALRTIGFQFMRGTKPAGEGLAAGECSWKDRGMHADEPQRLSQYVENLESLKSGGTLAPENRWYEELRSPDKYWTFMVSNNGHGQLIATSARPNNKKEVSPTARVPSEIGQILKRDQQGNDIHKRALLMRTRPVSLRRWGANNETKILVPSLGQAHVH